MTLPSSGEQPTVLDEALRLAGLGLRVLPIGPGKKWPLMKAWQEAATTDPATIENWWTHLYAGHGLGVATGPGSGVWVLDVDISGGKTGDDTLAGLEARHGPLPDTVEAQTGTGGRHIWFRWTGADVRNDAGSRLGAGLDIRGDGGQVLVPPTIHPCGRPYVWIADHAPGDIAAAAAPRWLGALLEPTPAATAPLPAPDDGPAARYNQRTTWPAMLEADGWMLDHADRDGEQHWRRPSDDPHQGPSGTVGWQGNDMLRVFTESLAWLPSGAYSRFGYYACRHHGGDRSAAARALLGDQRPRPPAAPVDPPETPNRHLKAIPASSIAPKPVHWLWDGRIALGTLALLAGREGIGKSSVAYDLAASLTRGVLPGCYQGQPRAVVVAATEDSWEHTIVPRLMAAGANLDMVYKVNVEVIDLGNETEISLPEDLIELERLVADKHAGMVILDPLISRLNARLDTHVDGDVRKALEPVVTLAQRSKASVLGVIHVNKGGGTDPVNMVMGSRAFGAVARSVLFAMKHPEDENLRLLGVPKNNLGRSDLPALIYQIEGMKVAEHVEGDIWTAKVVWKGEAGTTIAQALEDANGDTEQVSAATEAARWIEEFLRAKGGQYDSRDVKKAGKDAGFSQSSLERGLRRTKVKAVREGFPATTYWCLQEQARGPVTSTDPPSARTDMTDASDMTGSQSRPVMSLTSKNEPPARSDVTAGIREQAPPRSFDDYI